MKCPQCGKFLKDVSAEAIFDDIRRVWGICKTHGIVEPDDWCWDDFFTSVDHCVVDTPLTKNPNGLGYLSSYGLV